MITVYHLLQSYCIGRSIPPPSQNDLENCGRIISVSFKNYFLLDANFTPGKVIEGTGLMMQDEGGKKRVVVYYPDSFEAQMIRCFGYYYSKKNASNPAPQTPVLQPTKKRKRIPVLQPEFSVKPAKSQEGQAKGH